jgi:hypothetical protein
MGDFEIAWSVVRDEDLTGRHRKGGGARQLPPDEAADQRTTTMSERCPLRPSI